MAERGGGALVGRDEDLLEELEGVEGGVSRAGARRPPLDDLLADVAVVLGRDGAAEDAGGAAEDLAVDDVDVGRHVREVVEDGAGLEDIFVVDGARNEGAGDWGRVGVRGGGCFDEGFVEVALPVVEGSEEGGAPFVTAVWAEGAGAEGGDGEVALVHVPGDGEEARHEDGAAEGVGADALAVEGFLQAVQEYGGFDAVGLEGGLDARDFGGGGGGPEAFVAGEWEPHLVGDHLGRVAEHGCVDGVEDEGGKGSAASGFVCDPASPSLFTRLIGS